MLLDEIFTKQTATDRTTKFIVYNRKSTEVFYYGTDGVQAEKVLASKKGLVMNKPMIRFTSTPEEYARLLSMAKMFY